MKENCIKLDPAMLSEAFPDAKPGDEVEVTVAGKISDVEGTPYLEVASVEGVDVAQSEAPEAPETEEAPAKALRKGLAEAMGQYDNNEDEALNG